MESLVEKKLFNGEYKGKNVLVTGHTGFKGSWLCLWLTQMGANVTGYSKDFPGEPNHFKLLDLDMNSVIADIRDKDKLFEIFNQTKPEIVFHMAAQPLVRYSYKNPIETYETNVMGTLNVFEACRNIDSVKAIVNITSDKCYENKEWVWGYRENDPMGGYDPYSSSKGCAELITTSYRNSFFNVKDYGQNHNVLLASGRAGNVIGGGDWAEDRLIPDIMRAIAKGEKVIIRNPNATRPWQHVLEPLSGYLLVGQKLLEGKTEFAQAWNFGPGDEANLRVVDVLTMMKKEWDMIEFEIQSNENQPHEAGLLKLDCSKAHFILKWKNVWDNEMTFKKTVEWYEQYYVSKHLTSILNLSNYISCVKKG
ncbi:CDP-glucose 4,6-dehydratase [bacterium]